MKVIKFLSILLLVFVLGISSYIFLPEKKLPTNSQFDKLVVFKSKYEMLAYSNGKLIKTYKISLGRNPIGPKQFEGDKKTPEGHYIINDKNPNSAYYKNLGISYPNTKDVENAKRLGKPTGGAIKIHGLRNMTGFMGKFHRLSNWTLGCIAVTNNEIDEIFSATKIGTPIEIYP